MKKRNRLLAVVLVIVALVLGTVGVLADAQSTGSDPWFVAGYSLDASDDPSEILLFGLLLLDVGLHDVVSLVTQWADGAAAREDVREAIVDALRTRGDLASLEEFLLGEWVSNVEDAVFAIQDGAVADSEREIYVAMEWANELAYQASHFLDVLVDVVPRDVGRALERIATKAEAIDMGGLLARTADVGATLDAILDLIDDCADIKDAYRD